jgi:hypothetical protein
MGETVSTVVKITHEQGPLDTQGFLAAAVKGFEELTPAERAEVFQAIERSWENLQQLEDDL